MNRTSINRTSCCMKSFLTIKKIVFLRALFEQLSFQNVVNFGDEDSDDDELILQND